MGEIVEAIITGGMLEVRVLRIALVAEGVIEPLPRPPQKADAQFPRGLREAIKLADIKLEIAVQERGQDRNRGFAHANNADFGRPNDLDFDVRNDGFDGDARQKAGTPAA